MLSAPLCTIATSLRPLNGQADSTAECRAATVALHSCHAPGKTVLQAVAAPAYATSWLRPATTAKSKCAAAKKTISPGSFTANRSKMCRDGKKFFCSEAPNDTSSRLKLIYVCYIFPKNLRF